jgi:hypothetical protein
MQNRFLQCVVLHFLFQSIFCVVFFFLVWVVVRCLSGISLNCCTVCFFDVWFSMVLFMVLFFV